jgi:hypothetical protein
VGQSSTTQGCQRWGNLDGVVVESRSRSSTAAHYRVGIAMSTRTRQSSALWEGIEVGGRWRWEKSVGQRNKAVACRARAQCGWTTSAARRSRPRANNSVGVEQRSERADGGNVGVVVERMDKDDG